MRNEDSKILLNRVFADLERRLRYLENVTDVSNWDRDYHLNQLNENGDRIIDDLESNIGQTLSQSFIDRLLRCEERVDIIYPDFCISRRVLYLDIQYHQRLSDYGNELADFLYQCSKEVECYKERILRIKTDLFLGESDSLLPSKDINKNQISGFTVLPRQEEAVWKLYNFLKEQRCISDNNFMNFNLCFQSKPIPNSFKKIRWTYSVKENNKVHSSILLYLFHFLGNTLKVIPLKARDEMRKELMDKLPELFVSYQVYKDIAKTPTVRDIRFQTNDYKNIIEKEIKGEHFKSLMNKFNPT